MTDDIVKLLRYDLTGRNPQLIGAEAADEIERLRCAMHKLYEALREIHELYSGSECFPKPKTCAEAGLKESIMEMVAIAAEHKK